MKSPAKWANQCAPELLSYRQIERKAQRERRSSSIKFTSGRLDEDELALGFDETVRQIEQLRERILRARIAPASRDHGHADPGSSPGR